MTIIWVYPFSSLLLGFILKRGLGKEGGYYLGIEISSLNGSTGSQSNRRPNSTDILTDRQSVGYSPIGNPPRSVENNRLVGDLWIAPLKQRILKMNSCKMIYSQRKEARSRASRRRGALSGVWAYLLLEGTTRDQTCRFRLWRWYIPSTS